MKLSDHAVDKWRERVGTDLPSERDIRRMISESVTLQQFRILKTTRDDPIRVLALYWHPARQLVMKVDPKYGKVVTVLTPAVMEESRVQRQFRFG